MGKALLVYGPQTMGNGVWFPFGGIGASSGAESRSHFKLSEATTFSGLAWRATGASGTNTMRFRKNSANGNQVATRAGPGFAEDSTNTDAGVDNDLVNYSWADTGSDGAQIFVRSNVEFAGVHGNIHPCGSAGTALNLNFSGNRYLPLSGRLQPPEIDIENVQFKNRGYTSCESLQVVVVGNSKTTNTTFRINVNGTAVGSTITIAGGITGLHEVTGLGISLSDGDLVCVEWFGTGTQDFQTTLLSAVFKSTSGSSEIWGQRLLSAGYTRTASATPTYLLIGGLQDVPTGETDARIRIGFASRARNLRTFIEANSCTGSQTIKLFVNGSAQITLTIPAGATDWQENAINTFDLNDTDQACLEIVGGTSGSCLFRALGLTFSPIVAAGGIVRHMTQYYQEAA